MFHEVFPDVREVEDGRYPVLLQFSGVPDARVEKDLSATDDTPG